MGSSGDSLNKLLALRGIARIIIVDDEYSKDPPLADILGAVVSTEGAPGPLKEVPQLADQQDDDVRREVTQRYFNGLDRREKNRFYDEVLGNTQPSAGDR